MPTTDCQETMEGNGAALFLLGLAGYRKEIKAQLLQLPAWFRLSQFLLAVGAEEHVRRLDTNSSLQRRERSSRRPYRRAQTETVEPFSQLWYEVLDPTDRLLLEEYAGLNSLDLEETVNAIQRQQTCFTACPICKVVETHLVDQLGDSYRCMNGHPVALWTDPFPYVRLDDQGTFVPCPPPARKAVPVCDSLADYHDYLLGEA